MPRSRPLFAAACFASPVVAFATLLYVESVTAHAGVELDPEPPVLEPSPPRPTGAAGTALAGRPAPAAAARPQAAETTAAPAPSEPSRAAHAGTVRAPDLSGLRLTIARRTARALGLKVVARDEDGYRVSPEVAQHYRVRTQLTPVGSELLEQGTVEVRVRSIGFAEGY